MPNLPRYRLEYDEAKKKWALENEQGRTVRNFETKEDATARGVLKKAVGSEGGTVGGPNLPRIPAMQRA
jgi:hypothetical protein